MNREQIEVFFNQAAAWLVAAIPNLIAALVILAAGYFIAGWASRLIRSVLESRHQIDQTLTPVIAGLARYFVLIITFVAVLGQLGVQIASMLAVIGAAGLAIGLALQGTLSNIAAGLMLLWLRPFRVGDAIEAEGNISGTVTELGLFASTLQTGEGVYRFVPNQSLWNKSIINYSRNPRRRIDLLFTLKAGEDVAQAKTALRGIAQAHPKVLKDPAPRAVVSETGDDTLKILLRTWAATPDYWQTRWDLAEEGSRVLKTEPVEPVDAATEITAMAR
ncbi:MAG: mechanosensitive ion channel family protein [Alphaproteobacteria bacterium]|nr:mechanosensitive ion channel family protein [Alphaproteobacteria bacterium]